MKALAFEGLRILKAIGALLSVSVSGVAKLRFDKEVPLKALGSLEGALEGLLKGLLI